MLCICAQLEMQWQMANYDWEKFFEGCVSADFTQYGKRLVWVYEYQPHNAAVARHAHVHVTHKVFYADKGEEGMPDFMPVIQAPPEHQGIAPCIIDPAGELFMLKIPNIQDDPGKEPWVSSEMPHVGHDEQEQRRGGGQWQHGIRRKKKKKGKEGWGCERVFTDVLKTATAHNFPAVIRDQWKALKNMHATYQKSDELPDVPFYICPPADEASSPDANFLIDGQPVPWEELWNILAFRFKRPHAQHPSSSSCSATNEGQLALVAEEGSVVGRAKRTRRISADTLAAYNEVTSLNHQPAARKRARKLMKHQEVQATLPENVSKVEKDKLYFIRTSVLEGEMKVGLAMALEDVAFKRTSQARFRWFVRKQWISERREKWSDTPLFVVAGDPNGVPGHAYETLEDLSDVSPVPIQCTKACINLREEKTKPKLLKQCVMLLRAWCAAKGLLNDANTVSPSACVASSTSNQRASRQARSHDVRDADACEAEAEAEGVGRF